MSRYWQLAVTALWVSYTLLMDYFGKVWADTERKGKPSKLGHAASAARPEVGGTVRRGHVMMNGFNYQRFYDSIASIYGLGIRLLPMWQDYIRQALPWLPRTGRILEIGPGPGWLQAQLAEQYPMAVGFDLSPAMLEETRRHLRQAALSVRLVRGNAVHLPFATSSFDGIATTFAFSAIPDGLGTMREMARVLRPSGVVSLVDAGVPSDRNPIGVGLARTWELFGDYMRDEAALMREAGLEIVERREFGAFNSVRLVVGQKPIDTE